MLQIATCEDLEEEANGLSASLEALLDKQQLPHVISLFSSGEELIAALEGGLQFDLCLLDIYLAGLNGVDAARRVKELAPSIQVAFTTSSREFAVETFDLDAVYYLVKPVTVLTSFVLTAVTFPLMVLFYKKVLQPMFPLMGRRDLSRGCYFFAAALVLYFIEVYLLTFAPSALENVFMVMALVCMTLTDMILYYIFFSQIRLTAQNQQLAEQLRQFDEQYRVITGNVEEARRFRHDLRQHLNVISELNQENRRAELTAYLERYTESYQALDSQPLTGFFAVDNILRHYLARAQSEGVRVQTELGRFEDGLGFDPTDITVLLGNLLANALQACQKVPRPEERSLSISLRQREGALLISLANNCPTGSAEFSSFVGASSFPSTKRDGGRHGLGLKSVQMVADKYGGSAEYKREGGVFTARVVLNVP